MTSALAAILMSQEHHRTAWLLARRKGGCADVRVATRSSCTRPTRDIRAERHPALVLPTCTFVFGEYERRALLSTAYDADRIEVSGSPRVDLDTAADFDRPTRSERDTVRSRARRRHG